MRRPLVAAALTAAAIALAGCGGSSGGDNPSLDQLSPGSQPSSATTTAGTAACQPAPSASPKPEHFSAEPKLTIARTTYTARIVTNCGTIVVALDGKHAPHTVNSLAFLAQHHYFDHTPCHRLTTAGIFVLQCGDPTGTGTGGPGYAIPDENLAGATYPAGTVAMANAGPNTGGSQFFFVYANTQLDPNYTPFGHVVQGLDVLKAIAKNGTSNGTSDGPPAQPVVIESFTVSKG
ncbi:MAG TPA: peptidylprolyl isomerase [Mycobacteriales bacterium]|nr:peptidylprolyl isomerase [Mycobacteriales bacterium]